MKVEAHMNPTYTLNLTQDEYIAIIAAVFSSQLKALNKVYSDKLSEQAIVNINTTLENLAGNFTNVYQKEKSADIIKSIRLDGFNCLKEI